MLTENVLLSSKLVYLVDSVGHCPQNENMHKMTHRFWFLCTMECAHFNILSTQC